MKVTRAIDNYYSYLDTNNSPGYIYNMFQTKTIFGKIEQYRFVMCYYYEIT